MRQRPFNLPTHGETLEAKRLGEQYNVKLRKWAALLIHCVDCNGTLLATVTWIEGQPLAAAWEKGDRLAPERHIPRYWDCTWADRGSLLHARVGAHRHIIYLSDVHANLPPPRARKRVLKVRHIPDSKWGLCQPL
jgi:hypothetical protein